MSGKTEKNKTNYILIVFSLVLLPFSVLADLITCGGFFVGRRDSFTESCMKVFNSRVDFALEGGFQEAALLRLLGDGVISVDHYNERLFELRAGNV